jgi:glycosyltransferase involved in cell wall biosynthesis
VYSEFARGWMKRRWFSDSTVVYPPCRDGLTPAVKRPIILAVGRFVPDKKADVLVKAFRTLCDRGLRGWRLVWPADFRVVSGRGPIPISRTLACPPKTGPANKGDSG